MPLIIDYHLTSPYLTHYNSPPNEMGKRTAFLEERRRDDPLEPKLPRDRMAQALVLATNCT